MAHPETPEAVDAPATLTMADAAAVFDDNYEGDDALDNDAPDESEESTDEDLELQDEGDQDDEADEPEAPAIDPPASLNAEEKSVFAQLPPEAQQAWAASENRRNQQVQEATTKAAERERAATLASEQAEAAADARRATQLKAFVDAFRPQMPDPQLANVNPASYIAAEAQYRAEAAQFAEMEQQIEALGKDAQARLEQVDHTARANDLMSVPKLADPATRDEFIKSSLEIVSALGLDPTAFEHTAGSEDFKALEKVAEWKAGYEKYQKAMSRQMQKVRASKGKTLRPNAAPQSRGRGADSEQAWGRVKSAGNKTQQAEAMAEYLSAAGHI